MSPFVPILVLVLLLIFVPISLLPLFDKQDDDTLVQLHK
jgi:hypothetical protein